MYATALRCFFVSSSLKGNAPIPWTQPFPLWPTGVFPLSLGTSCRKTWNGYCFAVTSARLVGRRNRAILLLLARMGLRAGDIVHLRLGDIDWKEGAIRVCGKGRRETRLPLTQEVGDAI